MANTINKYVWLLNLLRERKRLNSQELTEAWLESGMADSKHREKGLSRKTIWNWRQDILTSFGVWIECQTKGRVYEYYIDDERSDKAMVRDWLVSTISVCNQLAGSKEISNRIMLEDVPSGQPFLSTIIDAMKKNQLLSITYSGFGKSKTHTFPVEPYFVKLFHQRWYLVANNPYYEGTSDSMRIYGLDRVREVKVENEKFEYPKDFDPQAYFEDFFGTDKYTELDEPLTIRIKVSRFQSHYWDSLPVHSSQKELEILDDGSKIYELRLYPTYDFRQFLLSQGTEIEILSPDEYRGHIAWYTEQMSKNYQNKKA